MGHDIIELVKRVQWERNVSAAQAVWVIVKNLGMVQVVWCHANKWMREIYERGTY